MAVLARELQHQQQQQQQQEQKHVQVETKKVIKKASFLSFYEVLFVVVASAVILFLAAGVIRTQTEAFSISNENAKIQQQIDAQAQVNRDLKNQVAELSKQETIIAKARALGMKLNGQNVKVVR